jgi:glycerol-3-phosphate cytidylyltransferase
MNGITLGTFDLWHYGHVRFLKQCRQLCETLTVAINTDEFIYNYKRKKPILTYSERFASLEETGLAHQIVPNCQNVPGDSCKEVILNTDSNLIIIGSDWARKPYLEQIGVDWDWLDEHKISLAYVPYTWEISATSLKERIANG